MPTSVNGTPLSTSGTALALPSQAVGDLINADSATTFARLADVATGSVLASGGTGTAPAWSANPTVSDPSANTQQVATSHYIDNTTTPGAYPYTTLDTDRNVQVDTTAARSIVLKDGSTRVELILTDAGDLSGTNNITVSLANAAKKLNGTTNGTLTIATSGAMRGFARDTSGNWRGGV